MAAIDHSHHATASPQGSFWTSRTFFVSLAFSAIAVFLLLSEHRAHFLGALPFLLLAAILRSERSGRTPIPMTHDQRSQTRPKALWTPPIGFRVPTFAPLPGYLGMSA